MSEWIISNLKSITSKIGSGATPTGGGESYKLQGISLIRSQNVLDYAFSEEGLAYIDEQQAYELRNVIIKENDVLLNITGDSVARCCSVPRFILPARVNQHVAIIRVKQEAASPRFVMYNLIYQKESLLSISEVGATRKALTKTLIEDFELLLPPLPEQEAIAEVLSRLDDKIDLLHRNNKTLEQLAETLFRQWFKIDSADEMKLGCLGDYFAETIGGEWGKEQPDEIHVKRVACIRGTDIGNLANGIPTPPMRYVKQSKFEKCKLVDGDIVIEISGGTDTQSTGRSRYFDKKILKLLGEDVVFSNFCRLLRPRLKNYTYFLHIYLNQVYDRGDFFNLENGTSGIKNLDLKAFLYQEEFPLPDEELIITYNDTVKPFFDKVSFNLLEIQKLEALRDTLLPKLMSGLVRVNH